VLSSPLRTTNVNVPLVKSVFVTSQRMLFEEPEAKAPAADIEPVLFASAP
jgi:hypothetical protein